MNEEEIKDLLDAQVVSLNLVEGINASVVYEDGIVHDVVRNYAINAEFTSKGFGVILSVFIVSVFDEYVVLQIWDEDKIHIEDILKTSSIKELGMKMIESREQALKALF